MNCHGVVCSLLLLQYLCVTSCAVLPIGSSLPVLAVLGFHLLECTAVETEV